MGSRAFQLFAVESRAVHEELPDNIGLAAKFQGQLATTQSINEVVGVAREKEIGLDGQHGKRKQALISRQLGKSEESYSVDLGVGSREDLEECCKSAGVAVAFTSI